MITLRKYLLLFAFFLTLIFIYHGCRRDESGNLDNRDSWINGIDEIEDSESYQEDGDEHSPSHQQEKFNYKPENNKQQSIHIKDILHSPASVSRFDFTKCSMSNCFDFSRCDHNGTLRVTIVPSSIQDSNEFNFTGEGNIIHQKILEFIRNSKYYEPNPANACIFILGEDTIDRDPLSQSFRSVMPNLVQPAHQYGINYLVFNLYTGTWPDYKENDFSGMSLGAAMLAKASNSIAYHRSAYDISIPLFSYLHQAVDAPKESTGDLTNVSGKNRTYFLTFKGKRYVTGSGSETRNSLFHLNNQVDVIMLTTCRHGKKWRESMDYRCSEDESTYNQYDFKDLMKESTFCLTPRGRRLGSFRFLEALEYGCIPVILSDGWVWPFEEIVDWSEAAIQFDEDQLLEVPDILRDIDQSKIETMSKNCLDLYSRYFSSIQKIVLTTLDIIERRIKRNSNR